MIGGRHSLAEESGICETGAWSGDGFEGQLNGIGASVSHSNGSGVWPESNNTSLNNESEVEDQMIN